MGVTERQAQELAAEVVVAQDFGPGKQAAAKQHLDDAIKASVADGKSGEFAVAYAKAIQDQAKIRRDNEMHVEAARREAREHATPHEPASPGAANEPGAKAPQGPQTNEEAREANQKLRAAASVDHAKTLAAMAFAAESHGPGAKAEVKRELEKAIAQSVKDGTNGEFQVAYTKALAGQVEVAQDADRHIAAAQREARNAPEQPEAPAAPAHSASPGHVTHQHGTGPVTKAAPGVPYAGTLDGAVTEKDGVTQIKYHDAKGHAHTIGVPSDDYRQLAASAADHLKPGDKFSIAVGKDGGFELNNRTTHETIRPGQDGPSVVHREPATAGTRDR